MKKYRSNGAAGAILDEYEKALNELRELIRNVSPEELDAVVDPDTVDPDCRSIRTILHHIIGSGYSYASYIQTHMGAEAYRPQIPDLENIAAYEEALKKMFAYNEQVLTEYPNLLLEEYDDALKIHVSWGQIYDIEQLLEHAIVHVLRHRRQIERFLMKLR